MKPSVSSPKTTMRKPPLKVCGKCNTSNPVARHKCSSCSTPFEIRGGVKKTRRLLPFCVDSVISVSADSLISWSDRIRMASEWYDLALKCASPGTVRMIKKNDKIGEAISSKDLGPVSAVQLTLQLLHTVKEQGTVYMMMSALLKNYETYHGFDALRQIWHPALSLKAHTEGGTDTSVVGQIEHMILYGYLPTVNATDVDVPTPRADTGNEAHVHVQVIDSTQQNGAVPLVEAQVVAA